MVAPDDLHRHGQAVDQAAGMATAGFPVVLAGMVSAPLFPTAASKPYSVIRSTPSMVVGMGPWAGRPRRDWWRR